MARRIKVVRSSEEATRYFCSGIGELITR